MYIHTYERYRCVYTNTSTSHPVYVCVCVCVSVLVFLYVSLCFLLQIIWWVGWLVVIYIYTQLDRHSVLGSLLFLTIVVASAVLPGPARPHDAEGYSPESSQFTFEFKPLLLLLPAR